MVLTMSLSFDVIVSPHLCTLFALCLWSLNLAAVDSWVSLLDAQKGSTKRARTDACMGVKLVWQLIEWKRDGGTNGIGSWVNHQKQQKKKVTYRFAPPTLVWDREASWASHFASATPYALYLSYEWMRVCVCVLVRAHTYTPYCFTARFVRREVVTICSTLMKHSWADLPIHLSVKL